MRMNMTVRVGSLLLALLACVTAASATAMPETPGTLTDPVFGLQYDPATVHYEPMPAEIRTICKDFNPDQAYWVFAHVRQGNADFYVVNTVPEDSNGAFVRLEGQDCDENDFGNVYTAHVPAEGYASDIATSPMPGKDEPDVQDEGATAGNYHYVLRYASEEAVLRGLIQDAAVRAEKAWGADVFRQKLCPIDHAYLDKQVPLLGAEVRKYCNL